MRYYAFYDNGNLICIGKGNIGTEITEPEYYTLLAEIREKARLVNDVYSGEITIADVPIEWQTEIENRVNELIEAEKEEQATETDYIEALAKLG